MRAARRRRRRAPPTAGYLAARTRDVAAAEDALAEAFGAALRSWPGRGVPDNPEAWLLTAARRNLLRRDRHGRVRAGAAPTLRLLAEEAGERAAEGGVPDERLKLLFVCAHPAIDEGARAPLMLQAVLGLDAARIAGAFLTAPPAMGQRLVRAKAKIRDAGLRFEVPGSDELPERLGAVLDAVYAAYGSGWEDVAGADPRRRGLTDEAVWLARLLAATLPGEPEAKGLLALVLHCEARRPARRSPGGAFVPLAEQDPRLWSRALIGEAEAALASAAAAGRPGRFQLEAAIQSAHAQRLRSGRTPWEAVAQLYEGLVRAAPTVGAMVGRAAAAAEARGAGDGLALLDGLAASGGVGGYQPYWALRAHLLGRLGDGAGARDAYDRAAGLTEDPAVRAFLVARRDAAGPGAAGPTAAAGAAP
jgi:predicted RNA polymerase sigma factor